MAHTFTITGCGTSAYNATYTYAGTQNSRPYWSNGSTSYLYSINTFDGNYWALSDALTDDPSFIGMDSCYALLSDANVPPKFGLVAVNGATAGDPVLAALEEAISITGAGDSNFNGRWILNALASGYPYFVHENDSNRTIQWSGVQWEMSRPTVSPGYVNSTDQFTLPTSGWTVDNGTGPAPSGFTTETLEQETGAVIRTDEIVQAGNWSRVGGSSETLDEVIGRDISYPSNPGADEPYIEDTTTDETGAFKFAMPSDPVPDQITEIRLRIRGSVSSGDNFRVRFIENGNASTDAVLLNGVTSLGWSGEITYNASTNAGSANFPIADPDNLTMRLEEAGNASFRRLQLAYVEIDYTYWATVDATAPSLSGAAASNVDTTTADGAVTTDEDNGTLYAVVTTSSTKPSAAQVKAGNDHTGSAATFSDSQAISSTGEKTFNATGLTESTAYYWHFMHEDAATNQSTVASSSQFTTSGSVIGAFTHFRGRWWRGRNNVRMRS